MTRLRHIILAAVLGAAAAMIPFQAGARDKTELNTAELVFNLAKFVAWPGRDVANPPAQTVFCAVGRDDQDDGFPRLAEKTFRGGTVRILQPDGPDASRQCDVVYIADKDLDQVRAFLDAVNGLPVFTVGDMPGFAAAGGMVELIAIGDHISFRVNLATAKAAGLIIKTPLLQMASIVQLPTH